MSYKAVTLVKRPEQAITADCFQLIECEPAPLQQGQFRVRQTHMSLDPAMRGWMEEDRKSYIPPVELGDVMRSTGVGEVIESRHSEFAVGARVTGLMGWCEQAVCDGQGMLVVPNEIEPEAVLAVLALPGVTAYHGLIEIAQPKAGETVLVTGGAGSVGSLVGQLAIAEGLRAVGVAGSDRKCRWMREELGFDAALNYRDPNLAEALAEAVPAGIDIFFENTGGPIQELALRHMNVHGRIVVCGMISDYNSRNPSAGPNWIPFIKRRLQLTGFAMPDQAHRWGELSTKVAAYLMQGKLVYRTHVLEGLESAIEGINRLFTGDHDGKLLVAL